MTERERQLLEEAERERVRRLSYPQRLNEERPPTHGKNPNYWDEE